MPKSTHPTTAVEDATNQTSQDKSASPVREPSITETRDFWVLVAYALVLGVFGAFVSLLFLGVIGVGDNWFSSSDYDWFGGNWWWIVVTTGVGSMVGLLHRVTHLPDQTPGLIADLREESVELRQIPGIVAVSAVSLIGGASLGPEKALGSIGGGAGNWSSKRRRLNPEDQGVNTLSGFAGAYGGLFSDVVVVAMMILEIARPGGTKLTKAITATIISSSVSFGIYFAIAGSFFLDAYELPPYTYKGWQLAAGVGFGVLAAVIVTLLGMITKLSMSLFGHVKQTILRATIGGALFGLIGVALPLTMFTGSDQLKTVISAQGTLGVGLLVALVVAKMVTFAVCQGSGFVGGPIFPALFIGGTAGVAFHMAFPSVPLGLAFTCLFAAVPGAVVAAPFSMVLVAAFMTQIGTLQTAPILIAVITAYLVEQTVQDQIERRKQP
ncbi:MAG TPA: chloride channel protein [Thermomicrobiales bacterium]|nr:chloride channel protein [Thermomicrobiales bacterium]